MYADLKKTQPRLCKTLLLTVGQIAEDVLDELRERRRVADEGAERHHVPVIMCTRVSDQNR